MASLKSSKSENGDSVIGLAFYDDNQSTRALFGIANNKPSILLSGSNKKPRFVATLDENEFANMFLYANKPGASIAIGVTEHNSQTILFADEKGEGRLMLGIYRDKVGIDLYQKNGNIFWSKSEYLNGSNN